MLPDQDHDPRIKAVLDDLVAASPTIQAVAVVRISGLTVMSVMPTYVAAQEHVSAMSAVMVLLGERITRAMKSGTLNKVYIKGDDGHIVLTSVGPDAVLMVTAKEEAPLGLLFVELARAAAKLKRLI